MSNLVPSLPFRYLLSLFRAYALVQSQGTHLLTMEIFNIFQYQVLLMIYPRVVVPSSSQRICYSLRPFIFDGMDRKPSVGQALGKARGFSLQFRRAWEEAVRTLIQTLQMTLAIPSLPVVWSVTDLDYERFSTTRTKGVCSPCLIYLCIAITSTGRRLKKGVQTMSHAMCSQLS